MHLEKNSLAYPAATCAMARVNVCEIVSDILENALRNAMQFTITTLGLIVSLSVSRAHS